MLYHEHSHVNPMAVTSFLLRADLKNCPKWIVCKEKESTAHWIPRFLPSFIISNDLKKKPKSSFFPTTTAHNCLFCSKFFHCSPPLLGIFGNDKEEERKREMHSWWGLQRSSTPTPSVYPKKKLPLQTVSAQRADGKGSMVGLRLPPAGATHT